MYCIKDINRINQGLTLNIRLFNSIRYKLKKKNLTKTTTKFSKFNIKENHKSHKVCLNLFRKMFKVNLYV